MSPKNEQAQYEKSQRDREDGKDKRGGKDEEGERSEESHQRNKINLVVRENSNSKASIHYYIIYKYWQKLIVLERKTSLLTRS